jgi:hypothetical protein
VVVAVIAYLGGHGGLGTATRPRCVREDPPQWALIIYRPNQSMNVSFHDTRIAAEATVPAGAASTTGGWKLNERSELRWFAKECTVFSIVNIGTKPGRSKWPQPLDDEQILAARAGREPTPIAKPEPELESVKRERCRPRLKTSMGAWVPESTLPISRRYLGRVNGHGRLKAAAHRVPARRKAAEPVLAGVA